MIERRKPQNEKDVAKSKANNPFGGVLIEEKDQNEEDVSNSQKLCLYESID